MEKIKAATSQTQLAPLNKLKQALKTKTMWMVIFGLAGLLTLKQVVKPWYEMKRDKESEEYANFLWEKSNKKSIEQ